MAKNPILPDHVQPEHAPWEESVNPQHDKSGERLDNDNHIDTSEKTVEKILPMNEESK